MSALAERLGLQRPVVQAGMGGGLSGARLAAAVSNAGGLGTVGILPDAGAFEAELRRARDLAPGRPLAANLLLPFARRAHADACVAAGIDVVVLFCGSAPELVGLLRGAGVIVLQQVGTAEQARQALDDGVDGLIAQGIEAGGHLLGEQPTLSALERMLDLAGDRPVLAAGGIHSASGAAAALAAGARPSSPARGFCSRTSAAPTPLTRRAYWALRGRSTRCSSRWAGATATALSPNAATDRWCARSERGPAGIVALNRLLAPALQRLPARMATATTSRQRLALPLYGPAAVLEGMDESLLDVTPLYAGRCAAEIHSVIPAAQAVAELSP